MTRATTSSRRSDRREAAGHVLPDVLADGLSILFCGSAAGAVSARLGAYYAGPGNKFWPTLHAVGITDRRLAPDEYPLAPSYGFGFTDMNKTQFGADSDLTTAADDPFAVLEKVKRHRPHRLAFTAKRPASIFFKAVFAVRALDYGRQTETIGDTVIHVMPSPSGLARRFWDEKYWRLLAKEHLRDRTAD